MVFRDKQPDRREIMESYFPEFLRGEKGFRVFIKISSEELGTVSDYIELFNNLANVDRTPEQFLEELGNLVGYSYIDEYNPDVQREIIKRVFNIHEARGDYHSMTMMASHGSNTGYLGGEIFLPGEYDMAEEAIITFPRDFLFTWNVSKRSHKDKYSDGVVAADGVMEILVGYLDDTVIERCNSIKPAGVRLIFKISINISNGGTIIKIPRARLWTWMQVDIRTIVNGHGLIDDSPNQRSAYGHIRWSGRSRHYIDVCLHYEPFVVVGNLENTLKTLYTDMSKMDIFKNHFAIPVQVLKERQGAAGWNVDFVWNGPFPRSGSTNTNFETYVQQSRMPSLANPVMEENALIGVKAAGLHNRVQPGVEIRYTTNGLIEIFVRSHGEKKLFVRSYYKGSQSYSYEGLRSGYYGRSGNIVDDSLLRYDYIEEDVEIPDNERHYPEVEEYKGYVGSYLYSSDDPRSGKYPLSGSPTVTSKEDIKIEPHVMKVRKVIYLSRERYRDPIQSYKYYKGVPKASDNYLRSGKYAYSGEAVIEEDSNG